MGGARKKTNVFDAAGKLVESFRSAADANRFAGLDPRSPIIPIVRRGKWFLSHEDKVSPPPPRKPGGHPFERPVKPPKPPAEFILDGEFDTREDAARHVGIDPGKAYFPILRGSVLKRIWRIEADGGKFKVYRKKG